MARWLLVLIICLGFGDEIRGQETIREDGVAVRYSGVSDDYARAIARTVGAARQAAIDMFDFNMPETIFVEVIADDSRKVRLFNDGQDRFSLTVRNEKDLAQPSRSGKFQIYGLCHEVAHLAMYRPIRDHTWLSFAAAEGWAHYLGSRLVDEVHDRVGDDLWPDKYEYRNDGTARLQRQLESGNASSVSMCAGQWQQMAETPGDDQLADLFAAWGRAEIDPEDPAGALTTVLQAIPEGKELSEWLDSVEETFLVKRPRSGFAVETAKKEQLDGEPRELAHDRSQGRLHWLN